MMNSGKSMNQLTRLAGWLIGSLVITLAIVSYSTNMPLIDMFVWAQKVFGYGFALLFSLLFIAGAMACQRIDQSERGLYWHEVGQQAGNGIAALALTFTLLGISLGIGSLSEQSLSPDNIQDIIANLTKQFSTAFMTTVVGLPAATLIRAWASIKLRSSLKQEEEV